jgi:adenylylsulfate kinase
MKSKPLTHNSEPQPVPHSSQSGGGNPELGTRNSELNIVWHEGHVTAEDRARVLGQHGCVLWFTGLSGSGKSTIARALEEALLNAGHAAYVLDGDNVRHGLNSDLDFSPESRKENIRRLGEVAKLFADSGLITITAFISPYQKDRDRARKIVESQETSNPPTPDLRPPTSDLCPPTPAPRFFEVYVNTPLAVCESRDPKKLYAKARTGEIPNFTGISAPFESPGTPEIELLTHENSIEVCVNQALLALQTAGII